MRLLIIAVLIAGFALSACRSSEYYHRYNSPAQRDADYAMCRDQADYAKVQQGGDMHVSAYKEHIIRCMEARGYVYQD